MVNMNKILLKDNNDKTYVVKDIESFHTHILNYHSSGISIHEENGYYFTVDEKFRKKIKELYLTYL